MRFRFLSLFEFYRFSTQATRDSTELLRQTSERSFGPSMLSPRSQKVSGPGQDFRTLYPDHLSNLAIKVLFRLLATLLSECTVVHYYILCVYN
jgi:hypothetical protein